MAELACRESVRSRMEYRCRNQPVLPLGELFDKYSNNESGNPSLMSRCASSRFRAPNFKPWQVSSHRELSSATKCGFPERMCLDQMLGVLDLRSLLRRALLHRLITELDACFDILRRCRRSKSLGAQGALEAAISASSAIAFGDLSYSRFKPAGALSSDSGSRERGRHFRKCVHGSLGILQRTSAMRL